MQLQDLSKKVKELLKSRVIKVWLLVAIYIFSRSFDRVLYRRWAVQMRNYDYMVGALIFPLGGLMASIVLLACAMALGFVPKNTRMMNQWPYIIAAIFDGSNSTLNSTATSFVPPQLDQALSQLVIPFTMIISFFALQRRYQGLHYVAAFLVVYGCALNVQPLFAGESMEVKGTDGKMYATSIWFILLDIVAYFPSACSNSYKEYTLKGKMVSVFWFSVFNSFYQTLYGFILIPYAFINWPQPKGGSDATPSTLGTMFVNGTKCFFGMGGTPDPADQCNDVWIWFLSYIFFNCVFNITLLKISKEVSGAFAAVVSAAVFILSDFLFLTPALSGETHPMHVYTVFGMIAVAIGVVMYGTRNELDKDGNELKHIGHSDEKEEDAVVMEEFQRAEEGVKKC
eukprot:Nk52_evm1s241 gene=Nk52_evmTU1s241